MEKNQDTKTKCTSHQLELFSDINIISDASTSVNRINKSEVSGQVIQMNSYKTKQQIELYYEAAKKLTAHLD